MECKATAEQRTNGQARLFITPNQTKHCSNLSTGKQKRSHFKSLIKPVHGHPAMQRYPDTRQQQHLIRFTSMWLHSQDVYADNTADCLLPKNGEEASTQFKEGLSTCQQRHATYTWLSTEDCCRHSLLTAQRVHSFGKQRKQQDSGPRFLLTSVSNATRTCCWDRVCSVTLSPRLETEGGREGCAQQKHLGWGRP